VAPLLSPGRALSADTRKEHDSIGELEIPNNDYYGVQTLRALENFPFDTQTLNHFPNFIKLKPENMTQPREWQGVK
jgi:aspartate ammonia-lyase